MFPVIAKHIFIVTLRLTQSSQIKQIKYKNVSQGHEYSTFRIFFSPSYMKKQYLGLRAKHNLNTISCYDGQKMAGKMKKSVWGQEPCISSETRQEAYCLIRCISHTQGHGHKHEFFLQSIHLMGPSRKKCRPRQWARFTLNRMKQYLFQ